MRKRPLDKGTVLELHAARRFHEKLREDRVRDAQWRKNQVKDRVQADRKAARVDGLVRTAGVRIAACRGTPTPLTARQMSRIASDGLKPGWARVKAAALVLEWTDWGTDDKPSAL